MKGKIDLKLSELDEYIGTTRYYRFFDIYLTDGVMYIYRNGYAWLIGDIWAFIKTNKNLRNQEFLSIKFIRNSNEGVLIFTDGNDKILYNRKYTYTDAEVDELHFYFIQNVLMLWSEY